MRMVRLAPILLIISCATYRPSPLAVLQTYDEAWLRKDVRFLRRNIASTPDRAPNFVRIDQDRR